MIELRPPADADNYRVKAGRFGDRFYTDPLPADDTWQAADDIYPSVSTVKKASGNDWSRVMAKRLSRDPSQLVEIGKLDNEFERKQRINLLNDADLGKASERGNIVHAHAEALLADRLPMYQMNDTVRPYIRTLDAFFAAYSPEAKAVEFVAIHRCLNAGGVARGNKFYGYGGTGDAVIEIDGAWWLVDWKSRSDDGDHKAYAEEAAQLGAYGRAEYWIVADPDSPNGAKRIKPLELAGGLIVSIKPDSYECFPIDLDEGFAFMSDLHAWWQGKRSETRAIGQKWAPRVAPTSQLVDKPDPIAEVGDRHLAPTPQSNKDKFGTLDAAQKAEARSGFERMKLNPNNPAHSDKVAWLLGKIAERPNLREMQEARKEQHAAIREAVVPETDPLEAEGGDAPDALVAESRLIFDMVLDKSGREWTGLRVQEANTADVSFRLTELRSTRRAHLYLALSRWAKWRGSGLDADEPEGNIEFGALLAEVDGGSEHSLGQRLGELTVEQAEAFFISIQEVTQSETDDEPVIQSETQPASEPASEPKTEQE